MFQDKLLVGQHTSSDKCQSAHSLMCMFTSLKSIRTIRMALRLTQIEHKLLDLLDKVDYMSPINTQVPTGLGKVQSDLLPFSSFVCSGILIEIEEILIFE